MSWIITDRETGKAVFETFDRDVAAAINRNKYEVTDAREYLERLNASIKAADTDKEPTP